MCSVFFTLGKANAYNGYFQSIATQNACVLNIDFCNSESIREAIEQIILDEMTIWVHPATGEVTYSQSCRNQDEGCEAHVSRIVSIVFDLSCGYGQDPFTILAIAKHESNYNPFVVNRSSGAVGLLQLMPRSYFARGVRYIHDELYRDECRSDSRYCQNEVMEASFELLRRSINRCGTIEGGLGMYGSGSCEGSRRFVKFVSTYSESIRLRSILLAEELSSKYGQTSY